MVTEAKLPLPSIVGMAIVVLSAGLGLFWPTCDHEEEPGVEVVDPSVVEEASPVGEASRVEAPRTAHAPAARAHGAEVVPVYEGERLLGFRVEELEPGSLFAEMGLAEGDVLTRVDTASEEGMRVVEVDLVRRGQPLTARYRHVEPVVHARYVLDADADRLMEEALDYGHRLVPAFQGGEVIGFKLFSIRPGTLFAAAGLENGDVVTHINGFTLAGGPDQALETYQRLKEACLFRLDLLRKGAPLTIEVAVPALCAVPPGGAPVDSP